MTGPRRGRSISDEVSSRHLRSFRADQTQIRPRALEAWTDKLSLSFAGRILPVDEAVAARWAEIAARAERSGKPKPLADGLIAATALQHDLTLTTRNVDDFEPFGVELFNPWVE